MHLLICTPAGEYAVRRDFPDWNLLSKFGHTMERNVSIQQPDAILSMGVESLEYTWGALGAWPGVPLFCYNWDTYAWTWIRPRDPEWDYRQYGKLLQKATEIWVPSTCTGRQTSLWWGLYNWKVILSNCIWWEYDNVRDDGFILCPLRRLPDNWCGKFEQACQELNLPHKMPDHNLPFEEYQDLVASCRFLVNHYQEASTGGLTLLEGYYLGKPCLITDSEWNGAKDYFGSNRATYFYHGNMVDFKHWLQWMWESTPSVQLDHRQWVIKNFSSQRMIRDILERINAHIG
jgi:hypothetical protein